MLPWKSLKLLLEFIIYYSPFENNKDYTANIFLLGLYFGNLKSFSSNSTSLISEITELQA